MGLAARLGKMTFSYEWTDADGNTFKPAARATVIPYTIALKGETPVLDGTAEGTEIDVSLPGIAAAATFIMIENLTGQPLGCAWGGNFSPDLPNGATMIYAMPAAPSQGGITGLRFFLRQAQVGEGLISYAALGS
jgi:hypothetical protein